MKKKKQKNEILITRVQEPSGWLSCMSPHPVVYESQNYRTVEALFQSLRFEGQPLIHEELRNCGSPMGAKMIARHERALLNRTGIWDYAESDRELMKRCLRLKLQQHSELELRLIETGEAIIIEDCTTHDREAARIWGQVKVKGKWVGQNILGQLWMELRSELVG
jgi:ribA/ribD-fused uncharacterized protein